MDNPWLMCGTQEILLAGDDRARQSHSPAVSKQGQKSSALPLTKLSFDLRGQARFAHCSKMPGRLPLLTEALGRLGLLSWQLSWEFPLGAGLSQVQPAQGRGMNRFGAGKEHRLQSFWGLMVPVRPILAQGLFWLMALLLASVPRTK